MHHSFDMCDECRQKSINVDLQTQNNIDDPVALYTCRLSWVPVTEESDHLASELQPDVGILDHPVSSLRISSAFQQHDVNCESTGCRDMTVTCFVCIGRKFSEPGSGHGSCGYLMTACDDHWHVDVNVEHHDAAAVNLVLPGTVPDSLAGRTRTRTSLHLPQHYHRSYHHPRTALKINNIYQQHILHNTQVLFSHHLATKLLFIVHWKNRAAISTAHCELHSLHGIKKDVYYNLQNFRNLITSSEDLTHLIPSYISSIWPCYQKLCMSVHPSHSWVTPEQFKISKYSSHIWYSNISSLWRQYSCSISFIPGQQETVGEASSSTWTVQSNVHWSVASGPWYLHQHTPAIFLSDVCFPESFKAVTPGCEWMPATAY